MKTIYFMRHGESGDNATHLFGQNPATQLTDKGKQQATAAGEELARRNPGFQAVVASNLARAQQTAQLAVAGFGFPLEKIETDERLKEIYCGKLEGEVFDQANIDRRDHEFLQQDNELGIEWVGDLVARLTSLKEDLLQRPEDVILLVGHGFSGRMLRRVFAEMEPTMPLPMINNTEIIRFLPYEAPEVGRKGIQ